MTASSRKEAKRVGVKTYFTGNPCSRGHIATRRTDNGNCSECNRINCSQYYSENLEYFREHKREWSKKNKDHVREYDATQRRLHPEKNRFFVQRYNQRKREATPNWLSKEQIDHMREIYWHARDCELVTGEKYHVDHIVPIINDDICGLHVPWNLQILPADINIRKGNAFLAQ
ncbi:MAG: hypothetical protein EBT13_00845 [Rhodobacteraceae bacterium]|nr:hypothetical protein [Paracoccaceae bacterium]